MKLKGILPGLGLAFGSPTPSPSLCSVEWTIITDDYYKGIPVQYKGPSCMLLYEGSYWQSHPTSFGFTEQQCDALQCCHLESYYHQFFPQEIPTSTFECYKTVS